MLMFTNQSETGDSAPQIATGSVVVSVSGSFDGASLTIVTAPDGIDPPAPVAVFTKPDTALIDFAPGQPYFARLLVRGAGTSVSVSVLPR